ncbi:MAG: filamentous hemagglutinin N-terminal domain-containing protein [Nostoc sp. ChiQUE02]|uniref:two-partner secretion domain-containing protein n=1 Tax=Nostoc sp. ChiQUE02 TaxID=3075377 RepID=UPI002AD27BCE|nr:filamentous hemagglutinin N-terminal domain-containing protein [Nostoc sp. ChiQUE02]MDZ8230251.1 filamentous hemagglutinin N-terminal domain-containing protein [Nostoc sp. ChiQUE02]
MNNSRKFAYSKPGLFRALGTIIPIAIVSILTSNACLAQIIPDTTLGNQNSRVMSGVNIKGNGADLIEGGVQSGTNLFHSFAEFNVNNGQRVYFANPTGIANILSRVTGNNPSNILGTLGVNGAANLFLLNPKGIIFGPNAQLDIQGSFLATTGNSFQFPDGSEFSATNPQAPPLLTMSVPVGVQFGSQPTASITNEGNLVTGKDLTLNAGNLDLQGQLQAGGNLTLQAQETLKIRDSATNPFIAAASGNLLAQGNQKVDISALNHPDSGFYSGGDMVLQSENTIGGDAHYWAGGNFRIEKLNGDLGNLFSPDDLVIRASGDVSFDSYEGASLHILAGGSVNIDGDVYITKADSTSNSLQETVTLSDGTTKIDIDGSQTPTLDIRAGVDSNYIGTPQFTPNPLIGFNVQNPNTSNEPTNANINIEGTIYNFSGSQSNSGQILVTNQYNPNKLPGNITTGIISTYGDVTVDSRDNITNNGKIDTTNGNNNGGDITLIANESLTNDGQLLSSTTWGKGNGGNISLLSRHSEVNTKGGSITSKSNDDSDGQGIGGDVTIEADSDIYISNIEASSYQNNNDYDGNYALNDKNFSTIKITSNGGSVYLNNSKVDTTNNSSGYAGNIVINAKNQVSILNGSKISSEGNNGTISLGSDDKANPPKSVTIDNSWLSVDNYSPGGNTGNINIYGFENVWIKNSNVYSGKGTSETNDNSKANGGTVNIESQGLVSLDHSQILSDVFSSDQNGNGGKINILARSLIIKNGSNLVTSTLGTGNAGDVNIKASDYVLLENSKISSSLSGIATGKAGNINITTNFLTVDKGNIEAQSPGKGDGGDIHITTNNLLLRRQSKISTTAGKEGFGGNGGSITINAKDGFVVAVPSEDSDIIANAFGGKGGRIEINANRILGFQNRGKLSSAELTNLDNNGISDISASSDVGENGEVSLNTLSIDPSQGLVALPTNLVDPSRLIAQGCDRNSNVAKGQSEFVITGRGGLPPSPDDTLKPGVVSPEWVVNNTVNNNKNSVNMTESNLRQLSSNTSAPLVEAVGMIRSANGDIVLTAQSTTATLLQSGLSTQACNVTQGNVR